MSPELSVQRRQLVPNAQIAQAEGLAKPTYKTVIPSVAETGWAEIISALTIKAAADGDMLPKTPEEILDLFSKGDSMVLVDGEDKFLSHAAITFRYGDGSVEVGAVCTAEDKQKNGYATDVIEALLIYKREMDPDKKTITLANRKSEGAFIKLGATEMDPSELDKDVWSACKDCKKKPKANAAGEFNCCHKPYDLTNFVARKPLGAVIFDSRASPNETNGNGHAKM